MLGYGRLSTVFIEEGAGWAKYVIQADVKGTDPHCVSILITEPEVANICDRNNAYLKKRDLHAVDSPRLCR